MAGEGIAEGRQRFEFSLDVRHKGQIVRRRSAEGAPRRSSTDKKLISGNRIDGPAIVETADTTVVVHPATTLKLDVLGHFSITFN